MKLTRAEFEALVYAASLAEDEWREEGGKGARVNALVRAMRKVHADALVNGGLPRRKAS